MRFRKLTGSLFAAVALHCLASSSFSVFGQDVFETEANDNWHHWRGPLQTGIAPNATPPTQWDENTNVKWKSEIPGLGHSSPVVWGNYVFLTCAQPIGEKFPPRPDTAPGAHDNLLVSSKFQFSVLAYDRSNGKLLWKSDVHEAIPHEGGHYTASLASASPVTDGKHVFAFFGTYGLYCLDFDGVEQWKTDLGTMNSKHGHGEGSSPAYYDGKLVINWDHEGDSFVVAISVEDGKEIWRKPRSEPTSWGSPIVVVHDGKPQVIISGTNRLRSYDLETGDVIWECGGLSNNVVATPSYYDDVVVAGSSYDTRAILAVKLTGASGDVTDTDQVLWKRLEQAPYVPSPLIYDKTIYFLRHYQNILIRMDAITGDQPSGPFRLDGLRNIYASPVGAADRVYVVDRSGSTVVFTHELIPRPVSINRLDDKFSSSPALVDHELILRGEKWLYCIAASEPGESDK